MPTSETPSTTEQNEQSGGFRLRTALVAGGIVVLATAGATGAYKSLVGCEPWERLGDSDAELAFDAAECGLYLAHDFSGAEANIDAIKDPVTKADAEHMLDLVEASEAIQMGEKEGDMKGAREALGYIEDKQLAATAKNALGRDLSTYTWNEVRGTWSDLFTEAENAIDAYQGQLAD